MTDSELWLDNEGKITQTKPNNPQYSIPDLQVWLDYHNMDRGIWWDIVDGVFTTTHDHTYFIERVTASDKIRQLQGNLKSTDYLVLKHMEGVLSDDKWYEARIQRQAWRDEINALEEKYSL